MQKQARVTPRNIQFQDNVQIRQIPGNDEQPHTSQRRPSWDPNLKDKNVFNDKPKKQRKVVIGIVIAGGVLLAIVIGVVVGVVVSQKSSVAADDSLTYNDACKPGSAQCKSSKGLSCPNGFCTCTSSLTWNSVNSTCALLTYNQSCSTSSQCDTSLQLVCTNQTCVCNGYYKYNSANKSCIYILNNTLTYGDACVVNTSQCNSATGLTCTGTCTCGVTKAWNVSGCSCPTATYLNTTSLCEPQRRNNQTCVMGSIPCDTARGLFCNTSLCACPSTKYWDYNFEQCYVRRNYSETCAYDVDCLPTLSCPTVAGVCNCSMYLADYTCNCQNTQYFNPLTTQCVSRATFGGACMASLNYTCLQTLYCNAGTCTCPSGKTWIAGNSTCT